MKEIAFIGNPNVGKSAWINALAHADLQVGNWAGVTVAKKEAYVNWDQSYHLIDLPGIYALKETQGEEAITQNYLKEHTPDLIVQVIDATDMKRSLYLTLLLRELQIPMMLLLNFMDEVEKHGMLIETEKLSRRLQVPIICASALDRNDYDKVKKALLCHVNDTVFYYPLLNPLKEHQFTQLLSYIKSKIQTDESDAKAIFRLGIGVVNEDTAIMHHLHLLQIDDGVMRYQKQLADWDQLRMDAVESMMGYVHADMKKRNAFTYKLDQILLHRFWGLPLFAVIFFFVLLVIFRGSAPWTAFIQYLIQDYGGAVCAKILGDVPAWMRALIQNGLLAGVGSVLSFVPLMAYMYGAMAVLEESGYMARIAFLMDRIMRFFHLSGRSFVAFVLGFGCNVPAIYATRTIENEALRKRTALLVPFMSCGARLPVYVLFAGAFFGNQAPYVIILLYAIGIWIALVLSFLLHQFENHTTKAQTLYLMQLPPYRLPRMKMIMQKIKQEVRGYVKKTMSLVIWVIIVLWALTYFPNGSLQDSYLAQAAKPVSIAFEPLGFGTNWKSVAALPSGIIAKESVIGFLGQLADASAAEMPFVFQDETKQLPKRLADTFFASMTLQGQKEEDTTKTIALLWHDENAKARAFSFLVYILLSIPCIMTLQALRKEYGLRTMLASLLLMSLLPYLVCFLLYQGLSLCHLLFASL